MIHITLRLDDALNTRLAVFAAMTNKTKTEAALNALMAGLPDWAAAVPPDIAAATTAPLPRNGGKKGGAK